MSQDTQTGLGVVLRIALAAGLLATGPSRSHGDEPTGHLFPAGTYVLGGLGQPARGKDAARIDKPFALHPDQYVLSGGPKPTDPLMVDDDLEVWHGRDKLFIDDDHVWTREGRRNAMCTYDGTPIILALPPGAKFRLRAIDCFPVSAELSDLWLHRWDGAKKRLVKARAQRSNAVLPHVFFDEEFDCTFPDAPARRAERELTPQQLAALWDDLASKDAVTHYLALWAAAAAPRQAVPFLRERLRPAAPADGPQQERIRRLIAQLDDDNFRARETASAELEKLLEPAEPALRAALVGKVSVEARRRIERLLQGRREGTLSAEELRQARAVQALEHMGTPQARQLLEALAKGDAPARLTREAKAALARLGPKAEAP